MLASVLCLLQAALQELFNSPQFKVAGFHSVVWHSGTVWFLGFFLPQKKARNVASIL